MPRLSQIRTSTDYKSTADLAAELFSVTTMTSDSYRALGKDGLARNQAMHAVGWALVYSKAIDATDKQFAESRAATTLRISNGVVKLGREFPGIIEAERKLFNESTR